MINHLCPGEPHVAMKSKNVSMINGNKILNSSINYVAS